MFGETFLLSLGQRTFIAEPLKIGEHACSRAGFGEDGANQRILRTFADFTEDVSDAAYAHQYLRKPAGPVVPIVMREYVDTNFCKHRAAEPYSTAEEDRHRRIVR